MNITLINELYGTTRHGGEQIASHNLFIGAGKNNLDLNEFSLSGQDNTIRIITRLPKWLFITPYLRELIGLPLLAKQIINKAEEADIIHLTSPTLFACRRPNKPYIVTVHGLKSEKAQRLGKLNIRYKLLFNPLVIWMLKKLERRGLISASRVIALTERTRDYLVDNLDLPADKIKIIPNGVDIDEFPFRALSQGPVLFVGRASIPKGIDILFAAVKKYKFPLAIVTKRLSKVLEQEAKVLGITVYKNIPHDHIDEIYSQASIFVLPSRDEEQPLTILEAMASGLPIITTKIGSGGLVTDGQNGIIVSADADQVGQAIIRLMNDKTWRDDLAKTSRTIAEKYTWQKVIAMYINIYNEVVSTKGSTSS
ncbi:glycosyltransferase family 4 protein [Patescibacteria group bacterium]